MTHTDFAKLVEETKALVSKAMGFDVEPADFERIIGYHGTNISTTTEKSNRFQAGAICQVRQPCA